MTETRINLHGVEVGALDALELAEAVGVLARGMRDNPLHMTVLGADPERRQRALARVFGAAATAPGWTRHALVARSAAGAIVGVCGMMPPGEDRPSRRQQLLLVPGLLRLGPRSTARLMRWQGAWARRNPRERHWRLGPLAVDAHLHGLGIGSRLMQIVCAQMDAAGDAAYLATDTALNVTFFERFGFVVIGEEEVLGIPNWFMRRPAAR